MHANVSWILWIVGELTVMEHFNATAGSYGRMLSADDLSLWLSFKVSGWHVHTDFHGRCAFSIRSCFPEAFNVTADHSTQRTTWRLYFFFLAHFFFLRSFTLVFVDKPHFILRSVLSVEVHQGHTANFPEYESCSWKLWYLLCGFITCFMGNMHISSTILPNVCKKYCAKAH